MKRSLAVFGVVLGVVLTAGIAGAGDNNAGFKTNQAAMLTPLAPGASVTPIITVGDTVRGYRFEAIPDGISLDPNGEGTVDVYVNHETSTVPFPYTPGAGAANQNDFDNAQVSVLRLNQHSAGVLKGVLAITSSDLRARPRRRSTAPASRAALHRSRSRPSSASPRPRA